MFKKTFVLAPLFILVLLFGVVSPAQAQGIITGDTIPAGTTVDDDVVLFGDAVAINGNVNGNVFALGNTVTVNGKVDGNLYAIGQQVVVNGEVTDGVYGTGLELDFGSAGKVGRNVAFLGLSIGMPQGSLIGRDLTGIFLLGAQFTGRVERDTTAVIGPLEFVRLIVRLFNIQAPPFLAPQTALPGSAKLAAPVAYYHAQQGILAAVKLEKWLLSTVREYISLLVIGLLALWLFPGHMQRYGEKITHAPLSSVGMGLVAIIVGNVGLALLGTVILAIALGIGWLGFSLLGLTFGWLGLLSVGTAYAFFFVISFYLSKIVVAFLVGFLILKRYERKSAWFRIGVLALGLLIYVLLAAIPFIGWAVAVVAILLGTGAIFLVFNDDRRFEKEPGGKPVAENPFVAKPAVEAPSAAVPAAAAPVVEVPAAEKAVVAPSPEASAAPVDEKPPAETPPTETPIAEKPAKPRKSTK